MPLSTPNKNETKHEFITRFMSDDESKKKFTDNKQRVAVAYSQWRSIHTNESIDMNNTSISKASRLIESINKLGN